MVRLARQHNADTADAFSGQQRIHRSPTMVAAVYGACCKRDGIILEETLSVRPLYGFFAASSSAQCDESIRSGDRTRFAWVLIEARTREEMHDMETDLPTVPLYGISPYRIAWIPAALDESRSPGNGQRRGRFRPSQRSLGVEAAAVANENLSLALRCGC